MKKAIISFSLLVAAAVISASISLAQTNAPIIKIVTPSEGQTLYGNKVPILVDVQNFEVADYMKYPQTVRGQGHIHLWLDDQNPTKESAVKLIGDTFTYSDVAYGNHILVAELVNNNHTSLTPPVKATVNFKSAPTATPVPAAAISGFDKNTALVILIVVALVIIAAWWYTKEEEEVPKSTTKRTIRRKASRRRK